MRDHLEAVKVSNFYPGLNDSISRGSFHHHWRD